MESYTLEIYPDEPIVVFTALSTFTPSRDLEAFSKQIVSHLEAAQTPLFFIADVREVNLGFDDILYATNYVTRTGITWLRHSNLDEFIVITTKRLIELATSGLSSDLFGNVRVQAFESIDDALIYIRGK